MLPGVSREFSGGASWFLTHKRALRPPSSVMHLFLTYRHRFMNINFVTSKDDFEFKLASDHDKKQRTPACLPKDICWKIIFVELTLTHGWLHFQVVANTLMSSIYSRFRYLKKCSMLLMLQRVILCLRFLSLLSFFSFAILDHKNCLQDTICPFFGLNNKVRGLSGLPDRV